MPRALSSDLRMRAVRLYQFSPLSTESIATILGISKRSVLRYIQKYVVTGSTQPKKLGRPVGSDSLTDQERDVLFEELMKQPQKVLAEFRKDVRNVAGKRLALSTLHYFFKRNGITRKKLKRFSHHRSEDERVNYRCAAIYFNPEMFLFLDESGFDKRIERKHGYSFRGYTAETGRWYGNWGPRITAIPVLCTEGLVELGIYRGTTNKERFLHFVNTKLVPLLQPFNGINPRSVVVMDNAAIHHCVEVIDAINASGALLMFLPRYSPDFNPCEGIFSQAKNWIRENEAFWQICDEPEEMIFEAFMRISDANVRNYLRFTEYIQ